ncbi:Dolichyl-diphosphooligosaccharide--protein glycotransferase [Durusdinium trenchii]|uniref:Dolichyl-diphosphooligosaccharide--protein glycotransferase n=1 Tax=Durusdinium trenchii TaxID=1381693 RepID=A0ABP0H9R9_9DINO
MSFLLVKNKPLPYQFALCARTFSQKHLTNSAAVTSVQTAQRLRNAATHGHRHADTCSGYPAAQKGSKGCEVFESVGENFQKLPTKAVAAAAREVLAKVAQLHQERKDSRRSAADLAPPKAVDLGRSLSSPCMLTEEGVRESIRVLGSRAFDDPRGAALAPLERAPREIHAAVRDFVVPMTCNQIYGSRWKTAQRPVDKFGKQSCDVCLFVDHMNKTKTPYCPHLRL